MPNSTFALDHYEFIRISGADTLRFLQGQLSCNTDLLSPQRSLCGALCNLKGRVIADFRLIAEDEGCIMQCAEGMAETILTTLNKYAVFSKVELQLLSPSSADSPSALGLRGEDVAIGLAALGLALPEPSHAVDAGDYCSAIRLPGFEERVELWFHNATAKAEFLSGSGLAASSELQIWNRGDIEAGVVHVSRDLSEEYTPQLLNYDISGLIDFKKGCYTGQEVVARMFYRGTAKKRLYLLSTDAEIGSDSRVVLASERDSKGGEILRFSDSQTPTLLLAVLATEAVESGEKLEILGQTSSDVSVRSLPYAEITRKVSSDA